MEVVSEPSGPYFGELAQGFALGAHIPVAHDEPWNCLRVYTRERVLALLADGWGVTDSEGLHEVLGRLLQGRNSGGDTDIALLVRRELAVHLGRPAEPGEWRTAAQGFAVDQGAPQYAPILADEIGRLLHIESRLRQDRVLGESDAVWSTWAYDFGRAVMMCRWGFTVDWIDERTATAGILHAGELARECYGSWGEFSAAFCAGRLYRFDPEAFAFDKFDVEHQEWAAGYEWYRSTVRTHHALMGDPLSPWRNLPFR